MLKKYSLIWIFFTGFTTALFAGEYLLVKKQMQGKSIDEKIQVADNIFLHYRKMMRQIPSSTLQNWVFIQETFASMYDLKTESNVSPEQIWQKNYVIAFGYSIINLHDFSLLNQLNLVKLAANDKQKIVALEDLGQTQENMGQYKESAATSKILVEDLKSQDLTHRNNYALRLLKAGNYDKAISVLTDMGDSKKTSHVPLFKARAYAFKKDYANADSNLKASCQLGYEEACRLSKGLETAKSSKEFWLSDCKESVRRWAPPNISPVSKFSQFQLTASGFGISPWFNEIYPEINVTNPKNEAKGFLLIDEVPFFALLAPKSTGFSDAEKYSSIQHGPSAYGPNIPVYNKFLITELSDGKMLAISIHADWQREWIQKALPTYKWKLL